MFLFYPFPYSIIPERAIPDQVRDDVWPEGEAWGNYPGY
jgi:hypothetical protein